MMYPACYRKLQLGGNQISTLAVYHYPFGKGYNLRHEFKGRYTMKKVTLGLASISLLSLTGTVQAVSVEKQFSSFEVVTKACEVAKQVWDIKAKGLKPKINAGEQAMLGYCSNLLDTTRTLVLLGNDSVIYSGICVPDETSHKEVLDKVLPILQSKANDFPETPAPVIMVVGLELAYPCKK